MAKNLISDPVLARLTLKIFEWVLPLLDLRHCRKLSLYAILRKRYDPNSRKCKKLPFGPDLVPLGPYSGRQLFFFFFKIWFCQSLDIMVSYHHVKYQKKIMIQSRENLVTAGRTERWTRKIS